MAGVRRNEMSCELANKGIEHLYKVSSPCFDDHQSKAGRVGNVKKVVKRLLLNCPEMPPFGTHRQTCHSVVGEQIDASSFWLV